MRANGNVQDLRAPLSDGDRIQLLTTRDTSDPDALYVLRHSSAHLLAEAVRGLVGNITLTSFELLATVPVELRDDLATVLSRCDLAKFAGVPITGAEREPLLANARHIRSATEPVESPR